MERQEAKMKCIQLSVLFLLSVLLIPASARAQAWSGILDPSRAIDWSNAGIPGGIPVRTTQCGSTIAPYSGSAATINNAIAACPAGQFVSLGAGTFNLSSGISFGGHSNVTLRGQGANSTFLIFSGAGAGSYNSVISMEGSVSANGYENNVCDWTGGYSPGTTTITIVNCGTTTPAKGSLSNLKIGTLLILDQLDEGNDTGQIWNCEVTGATGCTWNGPGGEARNNGPCNGTTCYRSQQQGVVVTAINGGTITISPGLYMPNWRSSQKPQAWFANVTVTGDGVEDMSIDATNANSGQSIMFSNTTSSWVKGLRSLFANRSHVRSVLGAHLVVRDNYFFENISHASVSYGAELMGGWDSLIENNIFQQDTDSEPSCTGACSGNVIGYNFNIDNVWGSAGWMQAGFYNHAAGDALNLWEGNIGPGYNSDQVHGTHHFETLFRNYLVGNQAAGCGSSGPSTCTAQTIPVQLYAGSRYANVVGNVLGQAGYHTSYSCSALSGASCPSAVHSIFVLGYTDNSGGVNAGFPGFCTSPACTTTSYYDPQTPNYLMRWGNYDVVTNGVRWCGGSSNTGWTTTCASTSEVPSTISPYGNGVPTLGDTATGQGPMPASFYLSSKPTWFGTVAWPPIGPDVSGGNISGLGGHANMNPAMDCYMNVMAGPANGSGSVLTFSATSCYGQSSSSLPAPPTGLSATIQ
jgi:hypothetical protein